MGDEQPEDPGQGGGGDLELQHVVVPLPLHAAWEVPLEELLHGAQVGKQVVLRGFDFHCDDVAISKPEGSTWQCGTGLLAVGSKEILKSGLDSSKILGIKGMYYRPSVHV